LSHNIDTLILGCTHYPALRGAIGRVVGPSIQLVDSASTIVSVIQADIQAGKLAAGSTPARDLQILTTDVSPSFSEVAARLMRPHGVPELQAVDIGTV
jgi:glutamate racemase